MPMIDRYELSLPGHMRLIDARSALNYLERFIHDADGPIDSKVLADKLEPLVEALHDASDETRPVDGRDAFAREVCRLNYIMLSLQEHEVLQEIRSCTEEGREEIYAMISEIQDRMAQPDPQ
ncbi:hypothetical protein [Pseudomonas sp. RC10]|uniref:hypothetical protein n=1 Tax=Pseudomonas bambusae TaxID=3139142 RepID=UPI00313A3BCD